MWLTFYKKVETENKAYSALLEQNRDSEVDQYVTNLDDMLDRSWTWLWVMKEALNHFPCSDLCLVS